jgi:hypothetical protein
MLAEAESDMTRQHLPFCCLWTVSYRTASSSFFSENLLFFKAVQGHTFFKKDYWLLSAAALLRAQHN